jgi:tRNA(Ile)-lysidine synthase
MSASLPLSSIPPYPLAVAVSGGADSMALALTLRQQGAEVTALHVDHQLRLESTIEAQQVQGWLTTYNIPCHILTVKHDLRTAKNLMAAAREARYDLMSQWCLDNSIAHLCVAHHAEDQAETFLMRLARGSGVDGLSAMRLVSIYRGVLLHRPLLHARRKDIEAYLLRCNQPWINDPTNANAAYTRTQMRQLLPTLEKHGITPERMVQATEHFARASHCLNGLSEAWITENVGFHDEFAAIPCASFAALHEELALRVIRTLLRNISDGKQQEIRFESLLPLVQQMRDVTCIFRTRTLHGCLISTNKKAEFIVKKEKQMNES